MRKEIGSIRYKAYTSHKCNKADRVRVTNNLGINFTGIIGGPPSNGEPRKDFRSSRGNDLPLELTINVGEIIRGWDAGLENNVSVCQCLRLVKMLILLPSFVNGDDQGGQNQHI